MGEEMIQAYQRDGFYLVPKALSEGEVAALLDDLRLFDNEINNYGVRDLMNKVPSVKRMAWSSPLMEIARQVLGEGARPVRSVYFDKVPGANWNVAWHQDTSIALQARHEVGGFGPWSIKQGVVHAEPPEEYLAKTLTLRLHLDASTPESGGLRVIPGTHRHGRIASSEILRIVEQATPLACNAEAGDLLLMNPLLFHSSRKASRPSHRRIVHIEYSAMALPEPLQWNE